MDSSIIIETRYNKTLTLKDLILLGLSITIGSGIFVLISEVAKYSGNLMWLSFLLAGIMILLTALSYGELVSIFRNNVAEYGFVKSVTNVTCANVVGILTIISDIFIIATISLGLGNYFSQLTGLNNIFIAIFSLVVINYLNYHGIQTTLIASNIVLFVKLGLLLMIIIFSFVYYSPTEKIFNFEKSDGNGLYIATIISIFAYLGFNTMINFTEETINPEITIGKSIALTIIIVVIIYTLLAIASLYIVDSSTLSHSTAPLATITGRLFGSYGFVLFAILSIVSLFDTLLVSCVSETRYIHGIFSQMSPKFGQYDMNEKYHTPYLSIMIMIVLTSLTIVLFKNVGTCAIYNDLLIMIIFTIVNIIVIVLRFKKPNEQRKFKIPFNIGQLPIPPIIAIITTMYAIYRYYLV